MLTVRQAAEKIGVSDSLIYEWCQAGLLSHYRFGKPGKRGKVMIEEAELDRFMAACRQQGIQEEDKHLKHIH